ncbi:MAG: hypothetical protein QW835_03020 [Candidatus Hadarchaeum sp.]
MAVVCVTSENPQRFALEKHSDAGKELLRHAKNLELKWYEFNVIHALA